MQSNILQLIILFALIASLNAQVCASNQYQTSDNSCVNCPANCTTCSTNLFCTACQPNYYLVVSSFNSLCQTCTQIFVGCQTCLSNIACSVCMSGYFMSGGICTPCSSKIIFCATCSNDGNTCSLCYYPYSLVNNLCISMTVSAITGGATGSLPTPSDNTNTEQSSTTTTSNSLITLGNGTKVTPILDSNGCNQIQIFQFGKCIKAISNCILYQSNGLCAYCATNFLVTIFGDCSPKNRFLRCEPGFWLNSSADVCKPVSSACDWYYPNNGSCLNCSIGYKWENNTCVQSVKCTQRQFFYQGSCITVPDQCLTFSSVDGTCQSCAVGYSLSMGICKKNSVSIINTNKCASPCLTCHFADPKYCFSCIQYWQLANSQYGKCIPTPRD